MSNHLQVVEQQKPTAAKQQQGMIMPAGTIQEAVDAFNAYQELKNRLGNDDDFQKIGDKKHPKKSFVRKVQRFFNVSCEIIQDEPLTDPKTGKIIAWLAKARAIHLATGAFQEADGSCGFEEKAEKQRTIHNIRAHAITRAKNRAILDLVGFGDVSAEELGERVTSQRQTNQQAQPARQETQQKSQKTAQRKKLSPIGEKKLEILNKAKEKGLNEEQVKKLVRYHLQRDTNHMTLKEAEELLKLVTEMSGRELVRLISEDTEAVAELVDDDTDIDPAEVEEVLE